MDKLLLSNNNNGTLAFMIMVVHNVESYESIIINIILPIVSYCWWGSTILARLLTCSTNFNLTTTHLSLTNQPTKHPNPSVKLLINHYYHIVSRRRLDRLLQVRNPNSRLFLLCYIFCM